MIQRILASGIFGLIAGAVPALPIMWVSSFTDDRPALWPWPVFGLMFAVIFFISPASREVS